MSLANDTDRYDAGLIFRTHQRGEGPIIGSLPPGFRSALLKYSECNEMETDHRR